VFGENFGVKIPLSCYTNRSLNHSSKIYYYTYNSKQAARVEAVDSRGLYLLKLSPPLGEEYDLVVERLPRAGLETELDDVDGGLPRAGNIAAQSHLLLDVEERLYRRIEVGIVRVLHPSGNSVIRLRIRGQI
jgi:hypothetical protein